MGLSGIAHGHAGFVALGIDEKARWSSVISKDGVAWHEHETMCWASTARIPSF